jgi:uncharacterized delta-60 repeat protein
MLVSAAGISVAAPTMAMPVVARLKADGALDTSFSQDGKDSNTGSGENWAARVVPFSGGKSLVAGNFTASDGTTMGILGRYSNDGTLDATFGFGGITPVDYLSGAPEEIVAVDVQSDLKIVVAGTVSLNGSFGVVQAAIVWRFNTDGTADTTFGFSGKAVAFSNGGVARDMEIMDDAIVVAGARHHGSFDLMAVARLASDGHIDTAFGDRGETDIDFGHTSVANGVSSDGGKIVVTGSIAGSKSNMGVARLNANGTLDSSFDGDGKVVIDYPGTTKETAYDVKCWPGQGCFVAGEANGSFAIARLTIFGDIDPNFGMKTNSFPGATSASANGRIGITNDLRVLISGVSVPSSGVGQIGVAKYTFTGQLDTAFSNDGVTTVAFSGMNVSGGRVALSLDPTNNKVVLAGRAIAP